MLSLLRSLFSGTEETDSISYAAGDYWSTVSQYSYNGSPYDA